MVKLKLIQRRNPKLPEDPKKFYASVVHDNVTDLERLSVAVSNRCTVRRADMYAALVALTEILSEDLSDGKVVSMGELGSFYINVKSEGADTAEDYTLSNVKGMRLVYRPGKGLKKKLRMVDFSLAI